MNRRSFFKCLMAAPVMTAAAAQDYSSRMKGLPPITIKDVRVITTSAGRNYRWVFLKIVTSEEGHAFTMLYQDISLKKPAASTFEIPTGFTKLIKFRFSS